MFSFIILFIVLGIQATTILAGVWPAGGQLSNPLRPGTAVDITWDRALTSDNVDIELWDGERRQYTSIAKGVPASFGHASWNIPPSTIPGSLYRFVVRDANDARRAEYTAGFHRIYNTTDFPTTVEDGSVDIDSLIVTPFPTNERARVAWTKHDARVIEVIDMQGITALRILPQAQTRACAINTSPLQTGQYTVVVTLTNGAVRRRPLLVSH